MRGLRRYIIDGAICRCAEFEIWQEENLGRSTSRNYLLTYFNDTAAYADQLSLYKSKYESIIIIPAIINRKGAKRKQKKNYLTIQIPQ